MPALENPRKAFAQSPARGALLNDAYENAGFVADKGRPGRLAYRAEVAERFAELRAAQTLAEDNTPVAFLATLTRIIKTGEGSEDPSPVRKAPLAIVDGARLRRELKSAQADDRAKINSDFHYFVDTHVRAANPVDA